MPSSRAPLSGGDHPSHMPSAEAGLAPTSRSMAAFVPRTDAPDAEGEDDSDEDEEDICD